VTDGHVQTVCGPIDPGTLGFTLPHEHTGISLWHVPNRWDYWELRRDQPIISAELALFAAVGGRGLVDLTLSGVGRDPAWLARLSEASGLHVVMGAGWYREDWHRQAMAVGPGGTGPASRRSGGETDGSRDHDPRSPVDRRARPIIGRSWIAGRQSSSTSSA
jgi:predicted metal-dependent phosphotriesterase family hydrolase